MPRKKKGGARFRPPANLQPLTLHPKASVTDQMGLPVGDVSEVHCQRSVHRHHQLEALLELLEILAQISSKKLQLGQELTPKARRRPATE